MKKLLTISLVILMAFCVSFSAFAQGEFVQSPSKNRAPELIGADCADENCSAKITITPFADRDNLPEEIRILIEKAYKDIAQSTNLVDLCPDLKDIAKELNIPEGNLAVSDLFDIGYASCEDHENHGYFDLVIKSDTFKEFVALMGYYDGVWTIIDNAKIKEVNGEYHLTFSIEDFAPLAIVVNSAVISDKAPHTGDTDTAYFFAVLMAVSAFAVVVLLKKNKKQTV